MESKIISIGAEATILKQGNRIIKKRIEKGYRNPEIDRKIRIGRTKREARVMEKISKSLNVPKIFSVNEKESIIEMEYINGQKLSEKLDNFKLDTAKKICEKIGEETAKLHNLGIIHGDLTTSNLIKKNEMIYFIDFGLSFHSSRIEDKAVDLHLFHQALESKHFKHFKELFGSAMQGYKKYGDEKVLLQLKKVEMRGRYKGKH